MRTSIATVCLSGTLTEKLHACAAAGFDGVEIFEPDLVAAPQSPEEIRALADRLGLSIDLYQPFRDAEGVTEAAFADVLRRARAKFELMNRLGAELMLVCSNVATATVDSDEVSARQLSRLADLAAEHGIRLAYEALAWGRYVSDYRRSWQIVQLADHPNLGVCLDSFHILSRGHDPAADRGHPGQQDLLPAAGRRAVAVDGRAVLEPAPPAVPRRGSVGSRRVRRPRAGRRLSRSAVAGGVQRHVPADRSGPDRIPRSPLSGLGCRPGRARPHRVGAAHRDRLRRAEGGGHRRAGGAARATVLRVPRSAPDQARHAVVGRSGPGCPQRAACP